MPLGMVFGKFGQQAVVLAIQADAQLPIASIKHPGEQPLDGAIQANRQLQELGFDNPG